MFNMYNEICEGIFKAASADELDKRRQLFNLEKIKQFNKLVGVPRVGDYYRTENDGFGNLTVLRRIYNINSDGFNTDRKFIYDNLFYYGENFINKTEFFVIDQILHNIDVENIFKNKVIRSFITAEEVEKEILSIKKILKNSSTKTIIDKRITI